MDHFELSRGHAALHHMDPAGEGVRCLLEHRVLASGAVEGYEGFAPHLNRIVCGSISGQAPTFQELALQDLQLP